MTMHIGHVAMQVRDLAESVEHARATLGLHQTAGDDGVAFLTANDKHHELQLIASSQSGLDHIGLEVESTAELDALRARIESSGSAVDSGGCDEIGLGETFRTVAPGGVVLEISAGMTRAPLSLENTLRPLARKLGHVTLFSDAKPQLQAFLLDVLGFRVSDRIGEFGSWMRCGADHHGIAVAQSDRPTTLHHYAFELEGWASIETYADRVARSGGQFEWGPGRHGPGRNLFTYLTAPGGAIVEAYADLLRIDNEAAYEPIDWSQEPRAMNLWGPLMPADWEERGVPALPAAALARR